MVYVIRLILGTVLFLSCPFVFAQTCSINGITFHTPEYYGEDYCDGSCDYNLVEGSGTDGFYAYVPNGEACYWENSDDDNNESGDSGSDSGNGGGSNSGGSGENSPDDPGSPDDDKENDTPENPGSGSGGGGNNEQTPPGIPYKSGIPENAIFCGNYSAKGNTYWHDCYDNDGDYWYNDYYESVCDYDEDNSRWQDCWFDGEYYGWINGESKRFDSYFDFKNAECLEDYFDGSNPGYGIEYASARKYCNDLYRDSMEAVLYDAAIADTKGNINVTDKLKGNKTVDIGNRLGISGGDASSYTSVFPDLLEESAPNEEGQYGTCLADKTLTFFGYDVVIPISIVCPWLEHLGTILVFLSLLVAFSIIRGSSGGDGD